MPLEGKGALIESLRTEGPSVIDQFRGVGWFYELLNVKNNQAAQIALMFNPVIYPPFIEEGRKAYSVADLTTSQLGRIVKLINENVSLEELKKPRGEIGKAKNEKTSKEAGDNSFPHFDPWAEFTPSTDDTAGAYAISDFLKRCDANNQEHLRWARAAQQHLEIETCRNLYVSQELEDWMASQ